MEKRPGGEGGGGFRSTLERRAALEGYSIHRREDLSSDYRASHTAAGRVFFRTEEEEEEEGSLFTRHRDSRRLYDRPR